MNTDQTNNEKPIRLPAWVHALEQMREQGLQFDRMWATSWFESVLGETRDTLKFNFAMESLRKAVEAEDGYYLARRGDNWIISGATEQIKYPDKFNSKMMRFGMRAINLRSALLSNQLADYSDEERKLQQGKLERDSIRYALMKRPMSIMKDLNGNYKKLTGKSKENAQ